MRPSAVARFQRLFRAAAGVDEPSAMAKIRQN